MLHWKSVTGAQIKLVQKNNVLACLPQREQKCSAADCFQKIDVLYKGPVHRYCPSTQHLTQSIHGILHHLSTTCIPNWTVNPTLEFKECYARLGLLMYAEVTIDSEKKTIFSKTAFKWKIENELPI